MKIPPNIPKVAKDLFGVSIFEGGREGGKGKEETVRQISCALSVLTSRRQTYEGKARMARTTYSVNLRRSARREDVSILPRSRTRVLPGVGAMDGHRRDRLPPTATSCSPPHNKICKATHSKTAVLCQLMLRSEIWTLSELSSSSSVSTWRTFLTPSGTMVSASGRT